MKVPSVFANRRASVELKLTPMIDCVFLLMIYFLWSANFGTSELSLPSKVSAASSIAQIGTNQSFPEADIPKTVVRILHNGIAAIWTINGTPVGTLDELRQQLASIAQIKADAPIILDPASDVSLGDVIDVFDLCRLVGFERVGFAASAPMSK